MATKITIEQAKKLNTNRLLSYYKKYGIGYKWGAKYLCDCCGEYLWFTNNDCDYLKDAYASENYYWSQIKKELNSREHVEK